MKFYFIGFSPILLLHADIAYDENLLENFLSFPQENVIATIYPYERKTGDEIVVLGKEEIVIGFSALKDVSLSGFHIPLS